MDAKVMEQAIFGLIGMVILVALAAASGILPWALFAGLGTSASVGIVSRKLMAAMVAGSIVTAIVSAFGIASMLSPGWYQGLV